MTTPSEPADARPGRAYEHDDPARLSGRDEDAAASLSNGEHEQDDSGVPMNAPSDHRDGRSRDGSSRDAVEERLRDAIVAYAEMVEPAPQAWARLNGRLGGHEHAPRRAVIAVLSGVAAVAAALVLVVVMVGRGDGSRGSVDVRPAATSPVTDQVVTGTNQPADMVTVDVYLIDQEAFNVGSEPYEVAVERQVPREDPMKGALDALFGGPTVDEADRGIVHVGSGATGVRKVTVGAGIARVYLEGGCSSGGSTLTVAAEIFPTLHQFDGVDAVKIYEPGGTTEEPDGTTDSIPVCLEP